MALADYVSAVLADTPKAYWECQDASGNPQDSSGNGLHMTSVTGTPDYTFATGPCGDDTCIRVIGGENLQRSSQVSTVTDNFTMELWYWIEAGAGDEILCNGNRATNGWGIRSTSGTKFAGLVCGIIVLSNCAASLTAAWRHIVVVRESGTWKYYVDGSSDTSNAGTNAPNTPSGTVLVNGGTDSTQARYAHIAIYETALSSVQVAAHYAAALVSSISPPFIASGTSVFTPVVSGSGSVNVSVGFISSATSVFAPTVVPSLQAGFISSTTSVFAPTLTPSGSAPITLSFVAAATTLYAPEFAPLPFDWEGISIGFGQSPLDTFVSWTRIA